MSDHELGKWIADLAAKHGFGSTTTAPAPTAAPSGGGGSGSKSGAAPAADSKPTGGPAAPNAPPSADDAAPGGSGDPAPPAEAGSPDAATTPQAPSGSGAAEHANSAEAAAQQAASFAGPLKELATTIQAAAQEAQKHKQEATTSQTTASKTIQGVATAPQVPPPQGADTAARYDSSIQISGTMRKAQQDAFAKRNDAQLQATGAATAAKNAATKAAEVEKKSGQAKNQAQQATKAAQAAAEAAKQAAAEAAKSKSEADKAGKDDANKESLQKKAQEDAQHAARAKAAAAKAVASAKDAAASAATCEGQGKLVKSAQEQAQKAADAVNQAMTDIDAKLAPFQDAVGRAEEQEKQCKEKLEAEKGDPQAVLQKRYEALGGDPELLKALAAEDAEFKASVEAYRIRVEDNKNELTRQLDTEKSRIEEVIQYSETVLAKRQSWHDQQKPAAEQVTKRANALGDKLLTEPGKEVSHQILTHSEKVSQVKSSIDYNTKKLEICRGMQKTIEESYVDLEQRHEASEKFLNTKSSELDNELQLDSMTLDEKVDFLQRRPKPVRERYQKQLDENLNQLTKASIANTMSDAPELAPEPEVADLTAPDWASIEAKISELEQASLETLKANDPTLVEMEKAYQAVGGDPALFAKLTADWNELAAQRTKVNNELSDKYRKHADVLQGHVDASGSSIKQTQDDIKGFKADLEQAEARKKTLSEATDPDDQQAAELTLIDRRIEQTKRELAAREEVLAAQLKAKADGEKLSAQAKQRFELAMDDDSIPLSKKPEAEDIKGMPLRAKYKKLTGKDAPA